MDRETSDATDILVKRRCKMFCRAFAQPGWLFELKVLLNVGKPGMWPVLIMMRRFGDITHYSQYSINDQRADTIAGEHWLDYLCHIRDHLEHQVGQEMEKHGPYTET